MRIRFRASDFGQLAKTNLVRANRNRLLVRTRMRRWCSGHLFARVIQQFSVTAGLWTQKIQANADYEIAMSGAAKSRTECTSLGP